MSSNLDVHERYVTLLDLQMHVIQIAPTKALFFVYFIALCPDKKAVYDEHLCDDVIDMTFHDVYHSVRRSAGAFRALGIKKGDHVAVFGENSAHWLLVDHGIQSLGGCKCISSIYCLYPQICWFSYSKTCFFVQAQSSEDKMLLLKS
jgi:hypothetical protein